MGTRSKRFYLLCNYEGVTYNPDEDVLMGFTSKAARTHYMAKLEPKCTALITHNQARLFYDLAHPIGAAGVYTFNPRATRERGRI